MAAAPVVVSITEYQAPLAVQEVEYSGGTKPWTDEAKALVQDDDGASCDVGGSAVSEWLVCEYDFENIIPAEATVVGVGVRARAETTGVSCYIARLQLWDGTDFIGDADTDTIGLTASWANYEVGGASELWGWTPVTATIRNGNFGIGAVASNGDFGAAIVLLDTIDIRLWYTYRTHINRFPRPVRRTSQFAFTDQVVE